MCECGFPQSKAPYHEHSRAGEIFNEGFQAGQEELRQKVRCIRSGCPNLPDWCNEHYEQGQEAKEKHEHLVSKCDECFDLAIFIHCNAERMERSRLKQEIEKIMEKCGQVSGNAIRNNVNSSGKEYYISFEEIQSELAKLFGDEKK